MKTQKLLGILAVCAAVGVMVGAGWIATAQAQSGSQASSAQQGSSTQGSATKQGSTTQGSTTQGSATKQGSTTQGFTTQGSATQGSATQGSATKQSSNEKSFEQKMWSFIKSTRYDQWAPAGDNGDFRKSDRPHGAMVKTYMNRVAAGNSAELPHGSIIVKENYSPEKKLMAVTMMYRSKGYNPDANDWYWIKYNADGTTAMMDTAKGKMAIAGKAKGCMECHSGADGDDYAFFND